IPNAQKNMMEPVSVELMEGVATPEADTVEVIVAKNRHGETGTAVLCWDGQFTKFTTLEEDR
ncbi:MAG: hypothetical protein IIV40_00810, partial [Oscillospiraceae bacterium]|nr:hypothetical protein [Oscillospiraceae bacterium]